MELIGYMIRKKSYSNFELLEVLRKEVKHKALKDVAESLGISSSYLCDLLKGNRQIGPKLYRALGLEPVTSWRKV